MPLQVTDIALTQLDADATLELIIAGGDSAPGFVLDGATRMLDWSRRERIELDRKRTRRRYNLAVVRDGNGWLVSIGRSFTTFLLRSEEFDLLVADGFQ